MQLVGAGPTSAKGRGVSEGALGGQGVPAYVRSGRNPDARTISVLPQTERRCCLSRMSQGRLATPCKGGA